MRIHTVSVKGSFGRLDEVAPNSNHFVQFKNLPCAYFMPN
jgi:hypothetical protein